MKKLTLPGGILPLFRMFIIFRLIWAIVMLLSVLGRPSIRFIETSVITGVAECSLLIGYLSWPWLQKRLGKYYLPIGLCAATVLPWVENQLILANFVDGIPQFSQSTLSFGPEMAGLLMLVILMQSIFTLFIPLILISWQYSMKWIVVYSLSVALLDMLPIVLFSGADRHQFMGPAAGMLVRTGLFLIAGYVINRLSGEQKERNRQLSHYAATLEQLSTSRERNRLAREIHDTLAHALSGLAVNLEAVEALWENNPAQAKDILKQSLSVTRSGLVETRRAIQALRAGPLEDLGLVLALKQLALSAAERYNLQPDLNLPESLAELDPAVEQCVYRLAEEGLRNLCQHAGAGRFSMALDAKHGGLEFTLADDGRGFDNRPEVQDGHFGLRGMRERAEAVGGTLEIASRPGLGTTLKLVVG